MVKRAAIEESFEQALMGRISAIQTRAPTGGTSFASSLYLGSDVAASRHTPSVL